MSSSTTDRLVDVVMPQMGVSVAEGTVVAWLKQPGDAVAADEPLLEITTDKIDVEIPAPAAGTLAEIVAAIDETVEIGAVLARIATVAPLVLHDRRPRRYSPVVQRIAAEHGIDLETVAGTGRDGRVRKQDVLALVHATGNGAAPEPPLHTESPYEPEAAGATLSAMRRAIGAHMKRSQQEAATCSSWIEVDMTRIERSRRALGTTALPHVARCAVGALREHPQLNAWLEGDRHTVHDAVHLGIAVSLACTAAEGRGDDGLVVPVLRDAHELGAEGLARRIAELADRAREGRLAPGEAAGGTFTITNPGRHGTLMATPVIHLPQVAILDVEAVVKRPVVVTDEHGADAIAIRPVCVLGLSWDHRALDGVLAARFLAAVKRRAEGYEG